MKRGYLQIIAVSDVGRLEALEGDHRAMADMSMGTPPPFQEIVDRVNTFERQLNRSA